MSSARSRSNADFAVGQDSFLDTTANLVGILIILVVVVGAQTKMEAVEYSKQQIAEQRDDESQQLERQAVSLKSTLQQRKTEHTRYLREKEFRKRERDLLLEKVALARQQAVEQSEEMSQAEQALVEQQQAVREMKSELESTVQELTSREEVEEPPKILLEHLPTPMARTVFTKELHLQLKSGRVTVIPWDRFVATLRDQVPLAVQRQSSRGLVEDTLGPLAGILLHYRMRAVAGGYELDRFELEPTPECPSEDLATSLSPTGRLRLELAARDPGETVVTAWVYPDSFAEFRKLKSVLFDGGFLAAARPLPSNMRISASPRGSRSSAQ
ncbi:MAG: hypothetical protein AB8B50_11265 [Pirellulaceae bacterium]